MKKSFDYLGVPLLRAQEVLLKKCSGLQASIVDEFQASPGASAVRDNVDDDDEIDPDG